MTPELFLAIGKASGVYAFMNTSYGWPLVESIHFMGLTVLLGTVGLFDLRMLGMARGIPMGALHRLVPFGVGAFLVNAATGSMFFLTAPEQYLYNPAFQLKVLAIAVAGVNVAVFYAFAARSAKATAPDATAPWPARIIAGLSLGSWIIVIICGRLITLFRPPYHWCFWC